jgi:hypothetical protein
MLRSQAVGEAAFDFAQLGVHGRFQVSPGRFEYDPAELERGICQYFRLPRSAGGQQTA